VEVKIHVFLTFALVKGEWSALSTGLLSLGEGVPDAYWVGNWEGYDDDRAGLDDMEK
jgi:hypothetical protein